MEAVVSAYLKYLKIPVSSRYFEKLMASHADYPSMLSATDTLERLGIPHHVVRIEPEDLDKIPVPYLLHLERKGGELIPIWKQADLDRKNGELKDWKGIVLKAEQPETVTDPSNQTALKTERFQTGLKILLSGSLLGLIVISLLNIFSWVTAVLLLLALAGATTGYILVAKDLGIKYQMVESFCNAGNSSNCDKILHSVDAKILGRITFSDLVMTYFLSQLVVTTVILPMQVNITPWLFVLANLSILTIPVVFYSIYYQALKARTWCRLCLVVDCILILEALLFGYLIYSNTIFIANIPILPLVVSVLLLLVSGPSVVLFKNLIEKWQDVQREFVSANRVKNSSDVFAHLLNQQKKVDVTSFVPEMKIGEPEAPIQVVMVVNLNCGPCKKKLEEVLELLSVCPNTVSVVFRLLKSIDNGYSSSYLLQYWLEKILGRKDEYVNTKKLLKDWYEWRNLELFSSNYQVSNMRLDETNILKLNHYEWIERVNIVKTPTVFINGYEFPEQYNIMDLAIMMSDLVEKQKSGLEENSQVIV